MNALERNTWLTNFIIAGYLWIRNMFVFYINVCFQYTQAILEFHLVSSLFVIVCSGNSSHTHECQPRLVYWGYNPMDGGRDGIRDKDQRSTHVAGCDNQYAIQVTDRVWNTGGKLQNISELFWTIYWLH